MHDMTLALVYMPWTRSWQIMHLHAIYNLSDLERFITENWPKYINNDHKSNIYRLIVEGWRHSCNLIWRTVQMRL